MTLRCYPKNCTDDIALFLHQSLSLHNHILWVGKTLCSGILSIAISNSSFLPVTLIVNFV